MVCVYVCVVNVVYGGKMNNYAEETLISREWVIMLKIPHHSLRGQSTHFGVACGGLTKIPSI